jgi:phosphatidate cytidylyltransferase
MAAARRRRERETSDLGARLVVAIPAAVVGGLFIGLGGLSWALFLIALGCVCLYELYQLLERWRPVAPVGFAALAGMVLAARYGTQRHVLEVMVAAFPVLVLATLGRAGRGGATVAIAGTLLGIVWVGLAFAHAELLRERPHGGGVTLDVVLGTVLGDTAAYAGGRLFGRRLLAPTISPGKTLEGLFCGMLIAIVAVVVASRFQSTWMTTSHALLLGAVVALVGPLGDLFESLIKRDAGAKDAGSVFGAHGGALDRVDAALFTIVAGYYMSLAVIH